MTSGDAVDGGPGRPTDRDLVLRPCGPEELDAVVEWERDADTSRWLGVTGREWHESALDDRDQEHLIAEGTRPEDGGPLGFVVLAGMSSGEAIELRRMVVRPDRRGEGWGRCLLRVAMRRAIGTEGVSRVWLDVRPHNHRARRLYASEGFVRVDDTRTAAETDTTSLIVMELGS